MFTFPVKAASSDVFYISNASGSKNDEVTIFIRLNKELAFASADLVLEYDASKLEYVKYEEQVIWKNSAMSIVQNNSNTGKIAIGYVSNPSTAQTPKTPGAMLSITFRIKSDKYEKIEVILNCTLLKNDTGENIPVSSLKSEISVNKNNSSSTTQETTKEIKKVSNDTVNKSGETVKTEKYSKKANVILPKTGESRVIIILAITLIIISIYFYKKYRYLINI